MTLKDVAKHLRVSEATASRIETGDRKVSGEEIASLAELFGVPISEIYGQRPEYEVKIEGITITGEDAERIITRSKNYPAFWEELLGLAKLVDGLPPESLVDLESLLAAVQRLAAGRERSDRGKDEDGEKARDTSGDQ